ncbi:alginate O-acetyltransferase AlgX-related protein [Candidatus Symbiobacter mobilis]|nr:hypothetical protein [Candidatus Symbiobacter mobilis]
MHTFSFRSILRTDLAALAFCGVVLVLCALMLPGAQAAPAHASPVVIGKDGWLFTPYEFATEADKVDTEASLSMLQKAHALFAQRGIAMVLVLIPHKIRVYAHHLPDDKPLDAYTAQKYDYAVQTLRAGGVPVVDLHKPFLTSPLRDSDTLLFFKTDTHWTPTGAMLAAERVRATFDADPALRAALAATPPAPFLLHRDAKPRASRTRDLARLLPAGTTAPPIERILYYRVEREGGAGTANADPLAAASTVAITAIGSSFTFSGTGYPDALRYTLQRDVLDISLPTDQGPWYGMDQYLRDASFRETPPKIILWEIPERELRSPPNYPFRDPRYIVDNAKWLESLTELLRPQGAAVR